MKKLSSLCCGAQTLRRAVQSYVTFVAAVGGSCLILIVGQQLEQWKAMQIGNPGGTEKTVCRN
jgi:hypothetical protein